MVPIKTDFANKANYGAYRDLNKLKQLFIVIHYTGNDGDSDESNGKYFRNNIVKASAHYFVDSDSITESVPLSYCSYSVGGNKYKDCASTGGGKYYKIATNTNTINIEICDPIKNGVIKPDSATINNALDLTRMLMSRYNIPQSNVIRHFDVNGKHCPAYWMDTTTWILEFWGRLAEPQISNGASAISANQCPYVTPTKLVKKGDKGNDVRWVQWQLNRLGYSQVMVNGVVKNLAVDGDFGTISDTAVRKFQKDYGLTVDGKVGNNTRKAILSH